MADMRREYGVVGLGRMGGNLARQAQEEGLRVGDTRFISYYHLFINREPWVLINSSPLSFYASRTYLANPKISTEDGDIAE